MAYDPPPAGTSLVMGALSACTDERCHEVDAPVDALWRVVASVGGDRGWYSVPGAWELRAGLDGLIGGVGLRRGRAPVLVAGDALDWWRIEEVVPGEMLRLRAEMRLPGVARMEMRAQDAGSGRSVYRQRVVFTPDGLLGRAYWASSVPFHGLVFGVMAATIARSAGRGPGQPVADG